MSVKAQMILLASVTILGLLACGFLPDFYNSPASGEPGGQEPGINLPGGQEPASQPVGLNQGLAALNSYQMRVHTVFTGPAAQDYVETTNTTEYNQDGDQFHSRVESTSSSVEEPTQVTSVDEEFRIGNQYCQVSTSDGEVSAEVSNASSLEQAMNDALTGLMDLVIVAENPTFIAAETVAGIPVNHFTFTVSGLGSASGAEVTQSQGDYWIAQDGQYIVKYQVGLEMRSAPADDPAGEVMHLEIQMDLTGINTPVTVTMPGNCQ